MSFSLKKINEDILLENIFLKRNNNDLCNNNNNFIKTKQNFIKLEKEKNKDKIKCNCKKTKCLKNYCECFRNKKLCWDCFCVECNNKLENIKKIQKNRQLIYIKSKLYNSCNDNNRNYKIKCKCIKNNCQKKYCDCYKIGKICDKNCKCNNCKNKEKNMSIKKLTDNLNKVNYKNHIRKTLCQKINNNKFVINKNIVNMIKKYDCKKSNN